MVFPLNTEITEIVFSYARIAKNLRTMFIMEIEKMPIQTLCSWISSGDSIGIQNRVK